MLYQVGYRDLYPQISERLLTLFFFLLISLSYKTDLYFYLNINKKLNENNLM